MVFRGEWTPLLSCSLMLIVNQFSPSLLCTVRKLIEEEGAVKIRSIVQSTNLPQPVLDLTHHYVGLLSAFRSSGSDG